MGGIRLITTLYTIFFVLIILIVIGSFFGVFDNPLIDPGCSPLCCAPVYGSYAGRGYPVPRRF